MRTTMAIARRCQAALLSLALASSAQAIEGPGDRDDLAELDTLSVAVAAVQRDLSVLCERASSDARPELCRHYYGSVGVWRAVDTIGEELDLAIACASAIDESRVRTDLRDEARYTATLLDEHVARLARDLIDGSPVPAARLRDEIRLARAASVLVERLSTPP